MLFVGVQVVLEVSQVPSLCGFRWNSHALTTAARWSVRSRPGKAEPGAVGQRTRSPSLRWRCSVLSISCHYHVVYNQPRKLFLASRRAAIASLALSTFILSVKPTTRKGARQLRLPCTIQSGCHRLTLDCVTSEAHEYVPLELVSDGRLARGNLVRLAPLCKLLNPLVGRVNRAREGHV